MSDASSIRVLHVDDDAEFAGLAAEMLERANERIVVTTATGADEGLDRLAAGAFDCVVSDYEMPGRNGIEFLEAVREEFPDLPFVLFTGKGSEAVASRAISAGVTDYLQKESGTKQYELLANRIENAVERLRADRGRRRSDRRFEAVFEDPQMLVGVLDPDGTLREANRTAMAYVDADSEAVLGEPFWATPWWDEGDRAEVRRLVERAADGEYVAFETDLVDADGDRYSVEGTVRPVTTADGEVASLVVSARDVSERTERERRLETLVDTLPGMVYRRRNERGWPMAEVRGRVERLTGYSPARLERDEGLYGREVVHPEDRGDVWEAVGEALDAREPFEITYRIRTADGETRRVREEGRVVCSPDGDVEALEGFITDVTEHRDRECREERASIEQALDALDDVLYVVGTDGSLRRWNDRLPEVTGHDDGEIAGMRAVDFFPEDERDRIDAAMTEALTTGSAVVEADLLTTDGDRILHEFTGSRLTDAAGDPVGLIGIGRDVTERRERERTIRDLHAATRDLLTADDKREVAARTAETVRDVLGYRNNVVRLVSNDGTELRAAGVTQGAETILGERPVYPVGEGTAGRAYAEQETLLYEDVGTLDDGYDRGDARAGMYVPIGEHGTLSVNETTPGAFDETDVRIAELVAANARAALNLIERTQLLERQNERLNEFTTVVGHDLRNPLNVAQGRLALAREASDDEHLADAADAVDRSLALLDDLLALARRGEAVDEAEPVELADVTAGCWRNVETADAALVTETERTIRADPGRLKQLLENLFRNAVEHGGPGVTVTVGDLDDGFYVADDGPGIPAAERERVFDAGYSTAEDGTGFGLNIVREIAEAHGWDLDVVESAAGGTRIEVRGVAAVEA